MLTVINSNMEDGKRLIDKMLEDTQTDLQGFEEAVQNIVNDVRARGDAAVFEYTDRFDKIRLDKDSVRVSDEEIQAAYEGFDEDLLRVIRRSIDRIWDFHEKQKQNSFIEPNGDGELLGQIVRPVNRAGVYAPGGTAPYPSSVLMNVVPARVAGVPEIIMTTPCGESGVINPAVLVAASEAGVTQIYKIGGAQAVAALAFGTESVPRVDKITGPGNIYVALAKRAVFGYVSIDSVAGPSEVLIIADDSANPEYVAADLLAQAEHDVLAQARLVTTSENLARRTIDCLYKQLEKLARKDIAGKSIEDYGAVILVRDLDEAAALSDRIAPEHLELCVEDPFALLTKIQHAGAVFLGHYTPEPLGDYMAGPNHILPTSGTARFFSPLCVDDFVKKSSVLSFTKEAMARLGDDVITFANAEGLTAHANSVRVRLNG